jgi:hypothetical protein
MSPRPVCWALAEQSPAGVPLRQKQSAPLRQNIIDLGDDFTGMLEAFLDLLQQLCGGCSIDTITLIYRAEKASKGLSW